MMKKMKRSLWPQAYRKRPGVGMIWCLTMILIFPARTFKKNEGPELLEFSHRHYFNNCLSCTCPQVSPPQFIPHRSKMSTQQQPDGAPPSSVADAVLVVSQPVPEGSHEVRGVDFDRFQGRDITVAELVENLTHTGFQGSAVAEAARIVNEMVGP